LDDSTIVEKGKKMPKVSSTMGKNHLMVCLLVELQPQYHLVEVMKGALKEGQLL